MYFKSPHQLETIFQSLEEKNLFLIANTKEREQLVEELRFKFENKKRNLEEKKKISFHHKQEITKNLDSVNDQLRMLKVNKNDGETLELLKNIEVSVKNIYKNDIFPEKGSE